jgi:hypothetical protein
LLGFDNYRQQSVDFCLLAADQAAPTLLKRPSQAIRREKDIDPCQRSYLTAAVIGHISDVRRSYAASLCIGCNWRAP